MQSSHTCIHVIHLYLCSLDCANLSLVYVIRFNSEDCKSSTVWLCAPQAEKESRSRSRVAPPYMLLYVLNSVKGMIVYPGILHHALRQMQMFLRVLQRVPNAK